MIYSVLDKWCDTLDKKYSELYEEEFYREVEKVDTRKVTRIWDEEMIYRKKYYLNFLISITGQQGRAFKSIFGLINAYKLAKVYEVPFDMKKHITVDPWEVDELLRKIKPSTTLLVDERKHKNVDVGSASLGFALIDYEEQGRITQKNIILATPFLYDDRHYFIFREHSHVRKSNKKCEKCRHNMKCHRTALKTMCKLKFYEREGYPTHVSFMLYTHSKIDQRLKPRGVVTYPVPTPKTFVEYSKVKTKIIEGLEKDESKGWDRFMKEAFDIFKKNPDQFVKELKNGHKVPQSITFVEFKLRDAGMHGKYPKAVINYMAYKIIELAIEWLH